MTLTDVISKNISEILSFDGNEGTKIKDLLNPKITNKNTNISIAHFVLAKGKRSKKHFLKSSETYYIMKGNGALVIDGKEFFVKKDQVVFIPPKAEQFIKNTGDEDMEFLCIVEPFWKKEDEIVLE